MHYVEYGKENHDVIILKENRIMRKSSAIIHQSLQNSLMQVLPGLYHDEFSINHGKDYANMIRQIIAE